MLRVRKILVAKKFMDKTGWEYQDFLLRNFCLTRPKFFVGELFSVPLTSSIQKVYG